MSRATKSPKRSRTASGSAPRSRAFADEFGAKGARVEYRIAPITVDPGARVYVKHDQPAPAIDAAYSDRPAPRPREGQRQAAPRRRVP